MANLKLGNKTVLSQSGSANPTWGANVPKGSVIEQFMSPCNGSAITVQSGTYTVQNVTAGQALTSSWADLTGSVITYTPPTGTQTVVFEFNYFLARSDVNFITHDKFVIGGQHVTQSYSTHAIQGSGYGEIRIHRVWAFHIGGSTDNASGRQATWTSGKELKLQIREYDSSHEALVHQTQHWAGGEEGSNNIISTPIIGLNSNNFTGTVTVPVNINALIAGPVTIPDITLNGTLQVIGDLNISGNTSIGSAGSLNISG